MKYNKWSLKRIREYKKRLTSRTKNHETDPEVMAVFGPLPFWFIKHFLYRDEGAESPEELQRRINQLFRRKVSPGRQLYVHVIDAHKVMEMYPE